MQRLQLCSCALRGLSSGPIRAGMTECRSTKPQWPLPGLWEHIRTIVAAEANGFINLPQAIDDSELLMRALVRMTAGDLKNAKARIDAGDKAVKGLTRDLEAAQANSRDAEAAMKQMGKDLAQSQKKVSDFEAKIAFLGKRWETLVGEVNNAVVNDPQALYKKTQGDLYATATKLYSSELSLKMARREIEAMHERSQNSEALLKEWGSELVDTRRKDQNLELENGDLNGNLERLNSQLRETRGDLRNAQTAINVIDRKSVV